MSAMVSRRRLAQTAAIVLGLLVLVMAALGVLLDWLTHFPGNGGPLVDALSTAAAAVPAVAVATLLAARRPGNPIGWLLFGVLFVGANPSGPYDVWAYRMHPGTVPFGWVAVVVQEMWPLFLVLVAILLWVFPDGRLPGGRWRRPSVILVAAGLVLGGAESLSGVVRVARHDVTINATGDLTGSSGTVFSVFAHVVVVLSLVAWLGWLAVQFPVYRRADGERRQQLKWLYSGAAISLVSFILGAFVIPLALGASFGSPANPWINTLFVLSFGALPAFMGVAVLKYRLYELDRIVSRVVSYALVSAVLVGVYIGLVLLITRELPVKSAVGVAVATLVTAALFAPVRRRVQRVVDRRFNRSRYDAEELVAVFTGRLRHTVEFDAVRDDLVAVVDQAFQPVNVSVWLALTDPGPGT